MSKPILIVEDNPDGQVMVSHVVIEHLKCIVVTAFHSSKIRVKALESGFDVCFSKPLDATYFARELQTCFDRDHDAAQNSVEAGDRLILSQVDPDLLRRILTCSGGIQRQRPLG